MKKDNVTKYEAVNEIARRRGFFWPSYEIYGGVSGFITYGPLGALLKRKIEATFRDTFLKPLKMLEIESGIITPAKVFEASGHVKSFKEPMVECTKCGRKFRADHLLRDQANMSDSETEKLTLKEVSKELKRHSIQCPECKGEFGQPQYFMTMFETRIGPYSDAVGYGRPEAAQSIFVEFRRLFEVARERLPLGLAQIGHALRNEISPRQGPIRLREFTIADIEFFFDPHDAKCPLLKEAEGETLPLIPETLKSQGIKEPLEVKVSKALQEGYLATEWLAYFMVLAKRYLNSLGVPDEKQRFIEKLRWERAHYSAQGYDQEVLLDRLGWTEVSGHNYRTDFDLKQHMKWSKVDMQVFKEYDQPKSVDRVFIKPIRSTIGPDFKEDAKRVIDVITGANAERFRQEMEKKGYILAEDLKILPKHVQVIRKRVEEKGSKFVPHVVEPSFGIDRLVYIALETAYEKVKDRAILKFPREIAPIQVAVFPLVTKGDLGKKAQELQRKLSEEGLEVFYDESGSIGRRYARADEAGIPLCITVDKLTLADNTVTVRDRNTWIQVRIEIPELVHNLNAYFNRKIAFEDLGSISN
jgi:glycyl-tRNA synthetase